MICLGVEMLVKFQTICQGHLLHTLEVRVQLMRKLNTLPSVSSIAMDFNKTACMELSKHDANFDNDYLRLRELYSCQSNPTTPLPNETVS